MYRILAFSFLATPHLILPSSCSVPTRRRYPRRAIPSSRRLNLKPLTSRIVLLTRRRQLDQIVEEVEAAKKRYGRLNTIVMNSVLEACVHCGDVDLALRIFHEMSEPGGCGLDSVSYATILKGLGKARRIDEAFQMIESIEHGTAAGKPKLSSSLIYGLLDALINAGDLRRANGLLARYATLLLEHGGPSILIYNLLMKGYITSGSPQAAVLLLDEMLRLGLEPDRSTYNTLIHACIKCGDLDAAIKFFKEMKKKAEEYYDDYLQPDVITYTTLVKGFGDAKDLSSLQEIFLEMKLCDNLFIDRTAFTAVLDAMLKCGSTSGALCVFGEILKRSGANAVLRPKPHLYLSMMRAFAVQGDYGMVRNLYLRLWPDTSGTISNLAQQEADNLLMEAALNAGQLDEALGILTSIVRRWKAIPWTTSGGMAAVRLEALSGFSKSILRPHLLSKVIPGEPIESIMIRFEATRPLLGTLQLKNVAMRFFKEQVVPIVDDWGSCIGLLHREDCNNLDAPLVSMMRSPPPCVSTTTSIGRVVDLILEKKHKMVIVVYCGKICGSGYSSKAVGAFTREQLYRLFEPEQKLLWWICISLRCSSFIVNDGLKCSSKSQDLILPRAFLHLTCYYIVVG
ncbi:pentatricopeptide repeat-containing protein At5g10690 isoform X2 [Eutrema salsugineum]|uniref:pentatricopeptide repeat-containing protein At5g10690 isoform X2 n=1 Tax=Eutrema salsugineum TaxID=72664 RepID=UPI000CECE558|nr:pentatricopeptide repeat-containing protein At5g10690 isoform X2 [Eutrema salsugineum]